MPLSPFHAMHKAQELSGYAFDRDKFIPVFASSGIKIYPYQIAAAQFTLRSPYLKGAILCDEGSLGKTYEAMLVIAQAWYEGKERLLLVIPTPLLQQWVQTLEESFSLPYHVLDTNAACESALAETENPFVQEGILLTTYDFAAEKSDCLAQVRWDMTVFEEAHHLRRIYTDNNKTAAALQQAAGESFKLLLTATPMQNSIMDLYGLISFIDDTVFPDEEQFRQRYFRKPENYPELAQRVSKYCFRTTRPQVATYVKIPARIPVTVEFSLTDREQELYDLLDAYVRKNVKIAFPKMDRYDLALMLFRAFSSSTYALERTLRGAVQRLEATHEEDPGNNFAKGELDEVRHMHSLAESITKNAKTGELLRALKEGFARLKSLGANQKALIFTENRVTQDFLVRFLKDNGYDGKVLAYNGNRSREYGIMERFAKEAKILVATDIAAEGFNLEFCSFVVNYDLPYNTLTIEQRINRCHRQGQQSDVVILNFLNRNNFADVRILELINKRILQFSGVFGMSDAVIGNFSVDLAGSFSKVLGSTRSKESIDKAYREVLEKFEKENKQVVKQAEQALFTSFTRELADSVTVSPQYIEEKIAEIHDSLWALTKYFFEGRRGYRLDDTTRTLNVSPLAEKVFTGTRLGRNEYSMAPGYQPRSGRHTVTGILARNILDSIFWKGIPERGDIVVDAPLEACSLAMYEVRVKPKNSFWSGYYFYPFAGKTRAGHILSDEECRRIMNLPVARFSAYGEPVGNHNRHMRTACPDTLDEFIRPGDFIEKVLTETKAAEKDEIDRLKAKNEDTKVKLERSMDALRFEVKTMRADLEKDVSRMEKLKIQKTINAKIKELKQREQNLFFDTMRLDSELESAIKADRTDLDMVYEIMLKMGVPLTEPVTQVSIDDGSPAGSKTAYSVGEECLLLICLVTGLTVEIIEEMAEYAPAKIIVAENSLADDSAMSNAHYTLRDRGIELKLV